MINANILKIASNTKYYGLKNIYTHRASVKNKKCGDIIKIELSIKLNKIKEMRYETSSCIFCQASASILSDKINLFTIKTLKKDIDNMLLIMRGENKLPDKYMSFKELLNIKNLGRYHCIMLPFNALIKALKV